MEKGERGNATRSTDDRGRIREGGSMTGRLGRQEGRNDGRGKYRE